tara:strand:- start:91 stop:243 length:153 start_codon:yes stop_codon:yes gene_type:complete
MGYSNVLVIEITGNSDSATEEENPSITIRTRPAGVNPIPPELTSEIVHHL